ncbi:MAG: transcription antitermination factor NusB [Anaerolineae bacterium]|nr:transcription antitermination factor NusB [Anaerolineae bacterium]
MLALQALYEIDSVGHLPGIVIQERLAANTLPDSSNEFAREVIVGVLGCQEILDRFIHQYAPEWPVDQMALVDRNILRIALFEFAVDGETPVKVAINEAVELAKLFGSDSSPRFINGVLGALVPIRERICSAVAVARQNT